MSDLTPSQIRYVWVSFDPDGTIVAHHDGASVEKNGTGDFTVTFSRSMPSSNYYIGITPIDSAATPISWSVTAQAVDSFRFVLKGGGVEVLGIPLIRNQAVDPDIGITIMACA